MSVGGRAWSAVTFCQRKRERKLNPCTIFTEKEFWDLCYYFSGWLIGKPSDICRGKEYEFRFRRGAVGGGCADSRRGADGYFELFQRCFLRYLQEFSLRADCGGRAIDSRQSIRMQDDA